MQTKAKAQRERTFVPLLEWMPLAGLAHSSTEKRNSSSGNNSKNQQQPQNNNYSHKQQTAITLRAASITTTAALDGRIEVYAYDQRGCCCWNNFLQVYFGRPRRWTPSQNWPPQSPNSVDLCIARTTPCRTWSWHAIGNSEYWHCGA